MQSKRESVEQWVVMWQNIWDESQKEEDEDRHKGGEALKSNPPEPVVEVEGGIGTGCGTKFERTVIAGILQSIIDELNLASREINKIKDKVEKINDDEELGQAVDTALCVQASIKEMSQGKKAEDIILGEWINITIGKILQNSEKMRFRSVNTLLKMILFKIVPYDLCFPRLTRIAPSVNEDDVL